MSVNRAPQAEGSAAVAAQPLRGILTGWTQRARNWRSRSVSSDSAHVLTSVQGDLNAFNAAMEQIFPPVGCRLMDLQFKANETASQTTSVAGLMAGDDGSLRVLDQVLQSAQGDTQADQVVVAAQEIQRDSKVIHQATEAVARLVNTFDVLGVMTRIESSRFESVGATFVGLADAVAKLSLQIREQIRATAESAAILRQSTTQSAEQMRRVAQQHRDNLGPLMRQIAGGLARVREHRSRVAEANTLLAARFAGVSKSVGDLVVALQSHDIVRQQVEHVVEGLRAGDAWDSADPRLCELARLQAAQLLNSRATFERSVRQMRTALSHIEDNIGEVAEDAERLLGTTEAGDASFFTALGTDLGNILAMMESNASADSRIGEATQALQQRIDEISRTIAGVYAIGIEMQRIALNAAIQAARLGEDGGALEVVAHAIQGLARQAEEASAAIESRLQAIRNSVAALARTAVDRGVAETQIAELRRCTGVLQSVQDTAGQGYSRTTELVVELKRQIRETIVAFGSEDECMSVLSGAIDALNGLAAKARSSDAAGLEQMKAMYTMQSERVIHEELYENGQGGQVPLPEAGAVPAQEDDVEFF